MISTRPYLLRAFYEWIVDNSLTPYILVNAEIEGVAVPKQFIEGGKIILNLSPNAVQALHITNQIVEFDASFSGDVQSLYVPIKAVEAIYARENGRGMVFNTEEEDEETSSDGEPPVPPRSKSGKPKLTVVK